MMRVLIVDDEAPVRRFLQRCVEADGADVMQAGSAEEALDVLAREGAPSVALCDLRLPGKDGLWLAKQLQEAAPETAVVMTTGIVDFDVAVTSLQTGIVDYVVKPFEPARLSQALWRAFHTHTSRRAQAAMRGELEHQRTQAADALAEAELNASSGMAAMLAMIDGGESRADGHAHRVAQMAVNLALMLDVNEPELSDIERAALFHDFGRLPGSGGYATLKNVAFLRGASKIAAAINERYDGTGTPHQLRGDVIPLGARIVAVADAYDELVTGAAAVAPQHAMHILRTQRTSEFDPLVLDALALLQPM